MIITRSNGKGERSGEGGRRGYFAGNAYLSLLSFSLSPKTYQQPADLLSPSLIVKK